MAKRATKSRNGNGANLGFEEKPRAAADMLRGHMAAAEHKHVVLGLVFLKYISDAFQELHDQLAADKNSDPEDHDEYLAENVFWVPKVARWPKLQASREEIESHGHVLTPGRYVGAEETEDDDDMPFDERMEHLTAKLKGQFAESAKLEKAILKNLASLGFTGRESA